MTSWWADTEPTATKSVLVGDDASHAGDIEPYVDALTARRDLLWVLRADWGLALVGAISILIVSVGVATVAGIVFLAAAVPGSIDFGRGAAFGLGTFPCMFGPTTAVTIGHGPYLVAIRIACVALPWMLYPVGATLLSVRFVWPRLVDDRRRLVAYPAKLASASAAGVAVLVAVLPGPPPLGEEIEGFTVRTSVAGAAFGAFVVVLATAGCVVLRRVQVSRSSATSNRLVAGLRSGVESGLHATVGLALLGTMIAVPAGVAAGDSTRERVEVSVAAAVFGVNAGIDTGVVAVGGVVRVLQAGDPNPTPDLDLWHFGAPPQGERNTQGARYLLLLAPLLAAGLAARSHLRRTRVASRGAVLGGLCVLVPTFALSFGVAAAVARLNLAGYSAAPNRNGALLVKADLSSAILGVSAVGLCAAVVAALVVVVRRDDQRPERVSS
jgi:hypothetical protein